MIRLAFHWCALLASAVLFAAPPPVRMNPVRPPVDLNTASQEALEGLPGIGPKLAQAIIAARPFQSVEGLDRVKGIGPAKLELLRSRVVVRGAAPARPPPGAGATNRVAKLGLNTATAAELETLPGIGPKKAGAIIAARPFASLEDLARVPGVSAADCRRLKDLISLR